MTPDTERNIARFVDQVTATINKKQCGLIKYTVKRGEITVTITRSKTPGNLLVAITSWSGYDMPPADLVRELPRLLEYHCEELEPREETK